MKQSLHIKGANIWDGNESQERDLFVKNGRIVDEKPHDALEVDLEGYTLFPGLINAHDHLELNHYPRTKFRDVYDNAHQWGEDVNAHLNDEPFKTLRAYPLWDRVFIGGLKNLLCGATTVIHHGPPHKPMFRKDFPVRVLKNYGWAHSLHFNTEEEIIRSYKNTPQKFPWFIHLAEGTDEIAQGELQKLNDLIGKEKNIVYVHGVSIDGIDVIENAWGKLIRCPSTNHFLLGKKAFDIDEILVTGQWWVVKVEYPYIGSDSRLTAIGDLLDEIRFTKEIYDEETVLGMIYGNLYWIYPEWNKGNMPADYVVVPDNQIPDTYISNTSRKDLPLVIFDGIAQIGDPEMMAKFPHIQAVACTLDGVEKRMNVDLAKQVHRCQLKERGLEVEDLPTGKRFFFF